MNNSVRVTREELNREVWETPIVELAKRYGISDRGLSKICKRLNIPTPGRGYWARKAAGKYVIQYQLPDADKDTLKEVVISEHGGLSQPNPDTQASISDVIAENSQLLVPDRLASPHSVIKGWLDEYKEGRAEERAKKKRVPLGYHFTKYQPITSVDRRIYRILHVIFTELEKKGYQSKSEGYESAFLEYEGIRVDFVLREKLKQERRPLTEKEKDSYFYRDKPWVQELKPTGKLQFSIKTYIDTGLRREWNETTKKSMEDHLPEIVALLTIAGPILVQKAREREEERRQFLEEEKRRHEQERIRKADAKQWNEFLELANAWQQADMARQFVTALEKNDTDNKQTMIGDRTIEEWLSWARDWINKTDPLSHNKTDIFEHISRVDRYNW